MQIKLPNFTKIITKLRRHHSGIDKYMVSHRAQLSLQYMICYIGLRSIVKISPSPTSSLATAKHEVESQKLRQN